jgi:hypothetical protein
VQLVREELVGETAGEVHEVVGGDGAGDCDTHDEDTLPGRRGLTVHATRYVRPSVGGERRQNYPMVDLS